MPHTNEPIQPDVTHFPEAHFAEQLDQTAKTLEEKKLPQNDIEMVAPRAVLTSKNAKEKTRRNLDELAQIFGKRS